jgi:hypothetical protein
MLPFQLMTKDLLLKRRKQYADLITTISNLQRRGLRLIPHAKIYREALAQVEVELSNRK